MTLMLCVDEPYASAIVHGLKTWETRGQPPNGEMRPDGVRGFPGTRLARGERIIVAATAADPCAVEGWTVVTDYSFSANVIRNQAREDDPIGRDMILHPGHVVGSVVVEDAVPITDGMEPDSPHDPHIFDWGPGDPYPLQLCDGVTTTDISDQLPWGNWKLGNWAWKLAQPKLTTEECPVCDELGRVPVTGRGSDGFDRCPACDGDGSCPPIPVRGHQGLRPFTTEALR